MIRIILVPAILLCLNVNAQNDRIKYIQKIQETCPNADIIEFESKTDYVEIEFICGDEVFENAYDSQMQLIYSETQTTIPDVIFGIIQKKLNKKFNGWILDEQALVSANDTAYYRIEILVDGIEQNAYFSLEGKNFKTKGITSQESWNISNLRGAEPFEKSPYSFLEPTKIIDLPDIIREVSGISLVNDSIMYCVQDELGIAFKYNLISEKIENLIRFTDIGDFEDIVVWQNTISILRSDGAIFQLNESNFNGVCQPRLLSTNSLNIEGLTYDLNSGRYLMVSKDMPIEGNPLERTIYAFKNLEDQTQLIQTINVNDIKSFIEINYPGLDLQYFQFNPSAIAVHPLTQEIYILSATNRMLVVYENGNIKNVYPLPSEIYYKPEGLTFASNGTLYISSEGAKNGSTDGQIAILKMK